MSNRSGIDTTLKNILESNDQVLFFAVKAEFDTETIYVWTGNEDIDIDGNTYIGAGTLLSISGIEEDMELKSNGLSVTVAGMDPTMLNLALTENYQNRFITVLLGSLSGGSDVVASTMILFKGRMTTMSISDDPDGSNITVNAENRLTDLDKPSNLRYTKESQKYLESTDTCFNKVALLQDKEIVWGKSTGTGGGGSSGGSSGGYTRRQALR